ncbi:MAG: ABC transporter ATP-binding protein [Flavobacteriaceae bacterium]|nr:ABC transporter ATP-binding protein [Flavobacteriaceae bacterium]
MLIIGVVFTVAARIFSLQVPRLIGDSLAKVEQHLTHSSNISEGIEKTLLVNILVIVGVALISGFFTFLMRQTIINVSRGIEFDLKNEIFNHYTKLTQRFFKNNKTGDLMNRISEDVSKVRMYFGPALMYSINTITLFAVIIIYMFSIAPVLSAYTILPFPVLSIIIYKLSRRINIRSAEVQGMLSKLSAFTQEAFNGISVIKSYSIQSRLSKRFNTLTEQNYQKSLDLAKIQAWFFPLMILLIGFSNLIVIFIGGKKYIEGSIDIGILAEFIIYVNMLTWPVALVGWITSIVQQAEASQERINDFLKEDPEIKDGVIAPKIDRYQITFDNVSIIYPETRVKALDEISFSIDHGQTLGILGKIGSGKTSILNLICRFYDPDTGTIAIGDQPIKDMTLENLRGLIGYVPQQSFLFSDTIRNNIRFGDKDASNEKIVWAAQNAMVHDNIQEFADGYNTLLGERGVNLSGGQVQRISIARALVKNPKILLLDDCLSAVDSSTEEAIMKNLKKFRVNRTTVIVSHRVSALEGADQIIVLQLGRVIESGNHSQLLSSEGYYHGLYKKQNSYKISI